MFDFESISSYYFYERKGMEVSARIIVSGMVQGVGFRFFVFRQATKLGLGGFTKNLYNGDVEIEASGDRAFIEELIREVKIGPRAAQVTDVKIKWIQPVLHFNNFEIR